MAKPTYSFVLPIFNEEEVLPELVRRLSDLMDQMDGSCEVILVDDGSIDRSREQIIEIGRSDSRFKSVLLSRNFGHQIALSAGLDYASGSAVILMDADLQDPPELVLEFAAKWREGFEIVYGIREDRSTDTWFKRKTAEQFYRTFRRLTKFEIPSNVGDFRLVDRRALDAIRNMPERSRFLRGMFTWVGFNQIGVPYKRPERFAGETKYPFRKMVRFAADGLVSFSQAPLRVALKAGFAVSLLAFAIGFLAIVARLADAFTIPGWASIIVVCSFFAGFQLMMLGVVGEYVGRIYEEVKQRPLYFVSAAHGFTQEFEHENPLEIEDQTTRQSRFSSSRSEYSHQR